MKNKKIIACVSILLVAIALTFYSYNYLLPQYVFSNEISYNLSKKKRIEFKHGGFLQIERIEGNTIYNIEWVEYSDKGKRITTKVKKGTYKVCHNKLKMILYDGFRDEDMEDGTLYRLNFKKFDVFIPLVKSNMLKRFIVVLLNKQKNI